MKKTRIICLLLALVLCLGVLASCDNGGGNQGGGDRGTDGSWDGVDFEGQTVNFCVSVNKYSECLFPAADRYTKGPDASSSDKIIQKVLERNASAESTLDIKVNYTTRDLPYDEILEDIQNIVITSSKNSPDIYNNDVYGLVRAMTNGYLWNVKNPGDDIKNYFDFSKDGWNEEFIKGCTYDQNKIYIFAGDYFIDLVRMAWVVFVNNDILAANSQGLAKYAPTVDKFYENVSMYYWDLDMAADMASAVHSDSGIIGTTESTDTTVGLAINGVTDWIISASSQITLFYQDKADGYKPKMMQDTSDYQRVANEYVAMKDTIGVLKPDEASGNSVLASTQFFLNGNVLFAFSRLGELEAEAVRNVTISKSLVPIPMWNAEIQEVYHTPVHDQAELGCILNTAKAFSAASALMQYLNEESDEVFDAYYEEGLKFRFNEDKNTRTMMDIVRDATDSPFSWQVGWACLELSSTELDKLYLRHNTTISSTFNSEKDVYKSCLDQMIEKFKTFE